MATPAQSRVSHAGRTRAPRLLVPREHGAYGQLLFPLATALLIGNQAPAALALTLACCAAFVAHEPVLVLLRQRGARARHERLRDAVASLAGCSTIAIASGLWSAAQMPAPERIWLLLPVVAALGLIPFIWLRSEHSTTGEIVAATGLASAGVPVALSGAVARSQALTDWLIFAAAFAVATVTVRSVIGRTRARGGPRPRAALVLGAVVMAMSTCTAVAGRTTWAVPLALLPVCGLSIGLALFPPHPRHLRTVGWALVSATAITAISLVVFR